MDKQMSELMGQLAEKLGTTAEHLWGALLAQAPIYGALTLIGCAVLILAATAWTVFVWRRAGAWKCEDCAFYAWIGAVVVCLTAAVVSANNAQRIAAAFFNPEYWALQEVTRLLGLH